MTEIFKNADLIDQAADDHFLRALHYELCPGGYYGSMRVESDLGDADAILHHIEIRAGVPGCPAQRLASYNPENIAHALDAFFWLQHTGAPLYYNGGMCVEVKDKEDLIAALTEALCDADDEEQCEELRAYCLGQHSLGS